MAALTVQICVSGFTQTRGNYHGILHLREQLITAGHAAGPTRRVWYLSWLARWRLVAQDLAIVAVQRGLRPVVGVAGYSYGGAGALRLCAALEQVGIEVAVLTLADPVGRRWWWPRPLPAVTSLLGRDVAFTLPVPGNVRRVNEFYQTENRPQGHRLRLTSTQTTRGIYQQLAHHHAQMDDAPEFHACVLAEAAKIAQDANRETI